MRKGKSAVGDAKSSSMSWGPLIVLCIGCFILVFDTTAMSVAINDLVVDLDTDISTVQAIMAIYTLVMASMMLMGAKLGDMYGRKKVFLIGVAVYGVGTVTAALSPNTAVLLTGWSLIEGLAAAAMLPATMALLASSYPDTKNRATAFAIYGGIAAAGAAMGPMLGGFIISELSWRWVFAGELILVVVNLDLLTYAKRSRNRRFKKTEHGYYRCYNFCIKFCINHSRILECRIWPFNSTRHVSAWHHPVRVFQIMDRAKKKAE